MYLKSCRNITRTHGFFFFIYFPVWLPATNLHDVLQDRQLHNFWMEHRLAHPGTPKNARWTHNSVRRHGERQSPVSLLPAVCVRDKPLMLLGIGCASRSISLRALQWCNSSQRRGTRGKTFLSTQTASKSSPHPARTCPVDTLSTAAPRFHTEHHGASPVIQQLYC